MRLFKRKNPPQPMLFPAERLNLSPVEEGNDLRGYRQLRQSVPLVDAALGKLVRLAGGFTLKASDPAAQAALDEFAAGVPVGLSGRSLQTFADTYLDELLTTGNAYGRAVLAPENGEFLGLEVLPAQEMRVEPGHAPMTRTFYRMQEGERVRLRFPDRIWFTALMPPPGQAYGVSLLHGIAPYVRILRTIYGCIGKNYERMGNVRYAVCYKPGNDPGQWSYAADRAKRIAEEWKSGMDAAAVGVVRDFVCAGDVEIRSIGADNPLVDTEKPVREILEEILAKLSIPPFLLGLNWSSTERMSSQQADILTSELEYYRRLLTPVLCRAADTYLRSQGLLGSAAVEWSYINLQDETELATARLRNAQAQALAVRDRCAGARPVCSAYISSKTGTKECAACRYDTHNVAIRTATQHKSYSQPICRAVVVCGHAPQVVLNE